MTTTNLADQYTVILPGQHITVATETEAEAISDQHAHIGHVIVLPDTDEDTYVPPPNPALIPGLHTTAIREARWWLTGLGYSEQDAAVMVQLMLGVDDMDITRGADLEEWLRDNQRDWPRY